jgi:PhnB protein
MTRKLVPYLNFDGDCRAAMEFYRGVFGGELNVQTFAEAHGDDSLGDRVVHARLESGAIDVMASDTHPEHSPPYVAGNGVHLSLIGTDREALAGWFEKLADGGKVTMPLEKQFWGDEYGALTDRFGMHWMVNISPAQAG